MHKNLNSWIERYLKSNKRKNLIMCGLLSIILIAEFIVSLIYIWKVYLPYEMNSDAACDVLVAKMLANSGHFFFLDDWLPGNELKIFSAKHIMALFFRIFSNYYIIWLLTSSIVFFMMIFVIFFFIHCCDGSKKQMLFTAVVIMVPFIFQTSKYTVQTMFYTEYYIFAFIIIGFILRLQNIDVVEKYVWKDRIILWIVSLLAGLCGIRSLMVITVPVIISWCALHRYLKINKKKDFILGISVIATICGYLICHYILERKYPGSYIGSTTSIQTREVILENLKSSPGVILRAMQLYAGQPTFINVILTLFYITMFICIIYRLLKRNKQFFSLFIHSIVTCFVTFMSMLLLLNNFSFVDGARYISLALFLWIPCFILSIPTIKEKSKLRYMAILSIVLLLVTTQIFNFIKIKDDTKMNSREGYVAFLINNGYTFGNSTWWNAYITDFYSEGMLEIHPVSNVLSLTSLWTLVRPSNAMRTPEFLLMTSEENKVRMENGYNDNVVYKDEYFVIIDL